MNKMSTNIIAVLIFNISKVCHKYKFHIILSVMNTDRIKNTWESI